MRRSMVCPLTRSPALSPAPVPTTRTYLKDKRKDTTRRDLDGQILLYCNSRNAAGGLLGLVSTDRLFHLVRTDDPHRSQVGPKVSGISGSIHKKFKTRAEAWKAFNRATREGTVRAVRVDPESDTASSSDSSILPRVARDNRRPFRLQQRTQGHHGHEIERPAPALHPATRLQSHFRRRRATDPTHPIIMSSAHAGPSGIAERVDPITMGGEPQNRRQSFNQESPEYVSNAECSASPSSRPVCLPTRGRSHERWQGSQYGPADALQSSSRADNSHTAIAHREARPVRTSTETRRRWRESPDAALLQSGSSYSMHMVSLLPQIDDLGTPGNAAHTRGTPLRSSPLMAQNRRTDIEPEGFDDLSFNRQAPR